MSILDTAIGPDGSFTATGTEAGVLDNARAKFKYSFTGYFEGATPAGSVTVAGTFREDVTFEAGGVSETCSSNDQYWSATHDPQPAPQQSRAVAGNYSGSSPGNYGSIVFLVAPGGRSMSNISVPNVGIACTPAGSFPSSYSMVISAASINPNGSFAAKATQVATFDNANARATYSFTGYFEGATPAGTLTVAGTFREDIVFASSGTTETCTSNNQSWTATHS